MPFGKKCRQSWIECLKKQVIKTHFPFVPKSMFEAEEKMRKDLRKNVRLLRITD
jgi:hypothetical protein